MATTCGRISCINVPGFLFGPYAINDIIANKVDLKKPLAIVTDIDETVLDNSSYSGKQVELDEDYNTLRWTEWVKKKKAAVIPGALDFLNYAKSKSIEVFYISNRSTKSKK